MKTVEIKNFELYTTGVISIAWTEQGEDIFLNVDLDLAAILKMLKIRNTPRSPQKKYCSYLWNQSRAFEGRKA